MKPALVDVPVLILFFNRPQQLSQVFEHPLLSKCEYRFICCCSYDKTKRRLNRFGFRSIKDLESNRIKQPERTSRFSPFFKGEMIPLTHVRG